MNRPKTKQSKRKWFRTRRRQHDPLLVFNMSIFNSGTNWERILSSVPPRENIWY